MRDIAKGDRVTQPQYGPGTVTEVNTHHTVIDFDAHGVHRFVTNRVSLSPTDIPAPPPAPKRARKSTKAASTNTV